MHSYENEVNKILCKLLYKLVSSRNYVLFDLNICFLSREEKGQQETVTVNLTQTTVVIRTRAARRRHPSLRKGDRLPAEAGVEAEDVVGEPPLPLAELPRPLPKPRPSPRKMPTKKRKIIPQRRMKISMIPVRKNLKMTILHHLNIRLAPFLFNFAHRHV